LLCVGRSIDLPWRRADSRRQGKSMSTAHLGVPAARSAAGTLHITGSKKQSEERAG